MKGRQRLATRSIAATLTLAMSAMSVMAAEPAETPSYLPSVGCIIEPSVRIEVSSPVEGVLEQRPIKLGEDVKKGQLLFSLRSDVEKASVELARIRAEFALRHYQRNDDLYQDELISVHERDEFQTDYQVTLKELQQSEAILGLRSVVSTIDGVVVDYFVESGEFVTTEPVMALATLDPLEVEVVMPYSSLGSVGPTDVLTVFPVEPVGGEYRAAVTLIDPVIDAASGTYRIRALIDNPRRRLPAGVECKVGKG
ncbi:efflux RND transporter periplasmic adaptor subunit [Aestuariicella hydrocarbonica]|uniref:Efflux RND transporter periplasmic adaptor subunit n=1 Tax=Pseudomaricurvus hydrocarbonicus TaxID=1470433 RepID=A0A9E5JW27_9GAMM|nr:efflux RND transporter periplasmic adaptor subunit [Aestuariicella hydrocarbonica]NHO66319.1 efflux RND transporter periplasmic adaptor subunit [Aestuariicella hydrocarbonica]